MTRRSPPPALPRRWATIAQAVTFFKDAAAAYEKQKRDSDALNAGGSGGVGAGG